MKRTFYHLQISPEHTKALIAALKFRFRFFGLKLTVDNENSLTIELSPMGRNLYPDESSEAVPFKLGEAVSIDEIRWENISCYVNGFLMALK